jgi:glycosyltransferase involved in cell wall biosynthesis
MYPSNTTDCIILKVCIVTSSFPRYPGDFSGFVVYDQALALSKKHEVHVIYPDNIKHPLDNNDRIHRHSIPYPFKSYPLAQVHSWELPGVPRLLFDMAKTIRKIDRQFGIDLFYAFWTIPCGFICSWSCRKTPMLLGIMGSDLEVFGRQSLTRPFIARAIGRADGIISVSEDLKREAIGLGGSAETIHVVPTGVDTKRFKPMDKKAIRAKLSIPDGFIWMFSGSLFKLKRVEWIIRLCARLNSDFKFNVLIVGDGPERQSLQNLAKTLGIDNIIFKGLITREDMPEYMAAADVLLLFSETEGLPNCIQEAMAVGMPVVATRVGGMPDIIKDGYNGYLVENESEAETALRQLMSSPVLAAQMGSNALSFARQTLSIDKILEQIVKICESMTPEINITTTKNND